MSKPPQKITQGKEQQQQTTNPNNNNSTNNSLSRENSAKKGKARASIPKAPSLKPSNTTTIHPNNPTNNPNQQLPPPPPQQQRLPPQPLPQPQPQLPQQQQQQQQYSSLKPPKTSRLPSLTTDTFTNPEPIFAQSSRSASVSYQPDNNLSPSSLLVPPSNPINQPISQHYHHPPKPIHHDASHHVSDDDEVQPIDRGEALVRRRMKERQRLKKEVERRQRRAADDQLNHSFNRQTIHSSAPHVRPTASRTRTAPTHRPDPYPSTSHRDPRLASPSLESLWFPTSQQQQQQHQQQHQQRETPERLDQSLQLDQFDNSTPSRRLSSSMGIQSSYQSFGSPSQFTSAPSNKPTIIDPSTPTGPSAINLPPQQHPPPPSSVKSSFSLRAKKINPHQLSISPNNEFSTSNDFIPRHPIDDDDVQNSEDDSDAEVGDDQKHYNLSTPTARGRAAVARTLSVRSSSTAAHSIRHHSSQFSVAPSKSGDHRRSESRSILSRHDDRHSQASLDMNPNIDPSPGDNRSDLDDSNSHSSALDDDVEYTLKDRQDAINIEHPFGLPIWKPALYKKSRSIARNAEAALHNSPTSTSGSTFRFGNLLWSLVFGIWLAVLFAIVAGILFVIPWGGSKYGRVVWELAGYLVWPFGKYVEEWSEEEEEEGDNSPNDCPINSQHQPTGPSDFTPGSNFARWVTVSEIDEDEVASIDRLTIRGGLDNEDEHTSLVTRPTDRSSPNYGATSPAARNVQEPKDRYPSGSTIKSDLTTLLGFMNRNGGPDGALKRQIRVRALGRLSFWAAYYLIIAPLMLFACLMCWFLVVTIPMAKLLWVLVQHIGTEPLALHFRSPPTYIDLHQIEIGLQSNQAQSQQSQANVDPSNVQSGDGSHFTTSNTEDHRRLPPQLKPGQPAPKHSKKSLSESRAKGRLVSGKAKVLLCTYNALGLQYYKYTVDGVNIIFINLIPFVIFVILDFFFLAPLKLNGFLGILSCQVVLFVMALLSVIPLSYFIGMAVASISAQSSIGMGAVINATFGSVIEIILYGIALTEGKGELVEGSIIGSVLAGVLLLPGMSMIGGSFKRKEQRFNARSAGVTSTMLIMAIIGTLTPTLFYEIYGTFQLSCSGCPDDLSNDSTTNQFTQESLWKCKSCRYEHLSPVNDSFYQTSVKGLSYYCAGLLVLSYLIGLWFSLRTHASQIWQTPAAVPHGGAEHGPGGILPITDHHPSHGLPPSGVIEHEQEFGHLSHQQRMSMYVRKLPEIVKQQLLPHLQRSLSGTRQSNEPQSTTAGFHNKPPLPLQSSERPYHELDHRDSRTPRTLTAEEVNQTLHVLQLASKHQLTARPTASSQRPTSMHAKSQVGGSQIATSHSRSGSRSRSTHPTHPPSSSSHYQRVQQPQSNQHHITIGSTGQVGGLGGGGNEEDHSGGHDAPNWSRTKSTTVLLTCTLLYAIIAEILVDVVDVVLDGSAKLPEKFLGISLFALVPNTTEFMNAISFAINGNIALSMEIGSAYALQVCLIQIPAMIAISSIYNAGKPISASHAFTLVFPRWDAISIIFSIFLLTYTYIEARANYHRGTILVLSYLVLIGAFYSAPVDRLDALSGLYQKAGSVSLSVFDAKKLLFNY